MLKLLLSAALFSLLLTGDALAGGAPPHVPPAAPPPHASAPPAAKPDPAKLRDCEQAWSRQRIKKGSKKAFIRACVRHG